MNRMFLCICECISILFVSLLSLSCEKLVFDEPISKHINICVLGNSYSNDAYSYVPLILREYGISCKIHIYYRGSGSLRDLDEQWYDVEPNGVAEIDGQKHVRRHYSIDTRLGYNWQQDSIMCANDILKLDKWDIISIQQVSKLTNVPESYYPYLDNIINKIDAICGYTYQCAWFMAYNRAVENQKEENNISCISIQQEIVNNENFDLVLPVATAVFDCQQNNSLKVLGDSQYHNMYASDNIHLQEGLPCYAAALAISEAILRKYKPEINVLGNTQRPTNSWIKLINGITQNGSSVGVTDENCRIAQEIAIIANNCKFEIIKPK